MVRRLFTVLLLALLLFGQGLFYAHFLLHGHALSLHSGRVVHGEQCSHQEGPQSPHPEGADEDLCQFFWVLGLVAQLQLELPPSLPLPTLAHLPSPQPGSRPLVQSALTVLDLAPSHSPPANA